ncbi:MAG TPA: hypothetical protein DD665_09355 [Alphaproteobacteria bacterium]|jgi:hypothetical protein|nr:hypothetical protein [Rhodospirillaceae bacterium]HAO58823.1 hypothetical protein [Alphaproteobacteria bacterium]HBD52458.1 hypothetical protein [Alphaproteobacteria bacterium]HBP58655.1 hypothetical protein [Alphaproteobacteria bacterium]HBP73772.1 hypothetical protein [Alphaproteobacteria bacterium]|tara:strand:+ start:181 stop:495 length:315 start_codon:yes stop_codon:yes gene_type:complete
MFFWFHEAGRVSDIKFTSYTTADFRNDLDLDMFIDAVERSAPIWVDEMKGRGLLKFSINRVWNKGGAFRMIMTYEHMNKVAYEASVAFIETTFGCSKECQKYPE